MASRPGILTDWPWKALGSFKYVILGPMVVHSVYSFMVKREEERDVTNFLILPFMLLRIVHDQIWISVSRYQTAKGKGRIVDKGLEFDQLDRESNWDDQIIMNTFLFYAFNLTYKGATNLPLWKTDGIILTILLHAGPVEFLYYWLHRALHHHFLYSRYHSHHHTSIVTQPITSVIHPFAETMAYFVLFAIPQLGVLFTGRGSLASFVGYIFYIDVMNNLGHCNFEFIPSSLFSTFPPLKYCLYTPSFHSLHHTQFRTNYSLFMPVYDYIYNTVDKSSDILYEASLQRPSESPNVVYLTDHLITTWPDSICHRVAGFAAWLFGYKSFIAERIRFNYTTVAQTWVIIPRYPTLIQRESSIDDLIEEAIIEAEDKGVNVLSLGLLNQQKELYDVIERHPQLKMKIVDGSSLVVAAVLNSIPPGTTQVMLRGNLNKLAFAIAVALSKRAIKVVVVNADDYKQLRYRIDDSSNIVLTRSYDNKIWLIGDGLTGNDLLRAPAGTLFIPFIQSPPKKVRKDCLYHNTPAMIAPKSLENLNTYENGLPRKAMSAWRVAGILHALEEWNVNECGLDMFDTEKVWQASIRHGFQLLSTTA